jgi:putative ABC transport system permease protein
VLLFDIFRNAYDAVRVQLLRSLLIILAMSIGITSVTVLIALSESARNYIVNEFESLGSHLVIILPGKNETTGGPPPIFGETPRDLTLEDAKALKQSPYIREIAPLTIGVAPVTAGGLERETNVFGSTHELIEVRHLKMSLGSFLPKVDADQAVSVCIIGKTIMDELFPNRSPLGKWLRINDRRFRVIGVLAAEGQSVGVDFDEMVIVPVASAQILFNTQSLFRILIETKSQQGMERAVEDAKKIIKMRHEGEEDITIITQDSVVAAFNNILLALTMVVACVGGISLFVAGILVMNVMLVSVTQRTTEIGLLKAIGATRGQIQGMFLAEAVLLSLAGALFGVAVGQFIIIAIGNMYPAFPIMLPAWGLLSALFVSMSTGLIFGVLPARKAAGFDPIVALAKR